jgi:type VI secretion system protein ImpC
MIPVEFDNLEDTLARLEVKLALPIGEGGDGVEVEFGELDSFHPDSLYRELPMFKALADLSKRLNNTATFAKAAPKCRRWPAGRSGAPRAAAARSSSGAPAGQRQALRLRPAGRHRPEVNVDAPVDALMKRIMAPFVDEVAGPEARFAGGGRSTTRSRTRCARCCIRASSRTSRRSGAAWT